MIRPRCRFNRQVARDLDLSAYFPIFRPWGPNNCINRPVCVNRPKGDRFNFFRIGFAVDNARGTAELFDDFSVKNIHSIDFCPLNDPASEADIAAFANML
jgi:hypothetical protein